MPFPIVGAVLSAIAAPIGAWLEGVTARRRVKEEGKVRIAVARVENETLRIKQTGDYDNLAQIAMRTSLKDEYLMLVITSPLVLSFAAPFIDRFSAENPKTLTETLPMAWAAVAMAPEWYQWSLMGVIAATFGLRWLWSRSPPLKK